VTGFPDDVLKTEARNLGAEYLVKPVAPPELLAAIERLLAGPDRQERRRWPRKRLSVDVPVEIDEVPARVIDVGYGGAQVEVFRPGATRLAPQLRVVFPVKRRGARSRSRLGCAGARRPLAVRHRRASRPRTGVARVRRFPLARFLIEAARTSLVRGPWCLVRSWSPVLSGLPAAGEVDQGLRTKD
jgi:hypothetical protein